MSPTRRHRAPGGDLSTARDQPDTAVGRGVRGIAGRGLGQTGRMGMIMADHARPPGPRRPVRGDQRGRIDLEAVPGLGRDIGASLRAVDAIPLAQQQPAHLPIRRRGGGGANEVQRIA